MRTTDNHSDPILFSSTQFLSWDSFPNYKVQLSFSDSSKNTILLASHASVFDVKWPHTLKSKI